MNKEFVTYERALALKELGFNEPCFVYWVFNNVEITFSTTNNKSGWSMLGFRNSQMDKKAGLCTAPTYSQAFRWFREKHNLYFPITENIPEFIEKGGKKYLFDGIKCGADTYEEAESACLDKLIEIVK